MVQGADGGDASRISGSLRSAEGRGVVRMEGRFDAVIDEVWSAITEPQRLAEWHCKVEGDLRPGGAFRIFVESDDWEGTGRVHTCDAPRRLVVTTRESEESWQKGQGVPPFDATIDATLDATLEATLGAEREQTTLVVEVSGLPMEPLPFYGVGWQIHFERLAAYLEGREHGDTEQRWDALIPAYQSQAAALTG